LPLIGAILFHLRAGRVTRLILYGTRERALADLGLGDDWPALHGDQAND
jgi:hypothetical protein